MNQLNIHFVDPAIPGISGRDMIDRAITAVQATHNGVGSIYRALRRDFALRKGLSKLDRRQLRDLGIDRGAA